MPKFVRKKETIEAIQLQSVFTLDGVTGKIGDWIVTYPDGSQRIVDDAFLNLHYEIAGVLEAHPELGKSEAIKKAVASHELSSGERLVC